LKDLGHCDRQGNGHCPGEGKSRLASYPIGNMPTTLALLGSPFGRSLLYDDQQFFAQRMLLGRKRHEFFMPELDSSAGSEAMS